ncbi:MAG: Hsp20/alpha crystallin family protein [Planctomycetes bacterium]|nr:Hsp20/alpha crystallin family protein [Planctomycetota bacterium]
MPPDRRSNMNEEMIKLARRMNQLMDEWMHAPFMGDPGEAWQPAVDVIECEHRICVLADLAGMAREAIGVTIERNRVIISGVRQLPGADRQKHVHQLELPRGPFRRAITIPFEAETLPFEIEYSDGLLQILIDKPSV